ncbi:concanavalin A-like lectin/glucanase domain-containing protein [Trametes elegans]|nr:concanavalin A-like lectin/glucanase domain-containing protein [Trametes elegans]
MRVRFTTVSLACLLVPHARAGYTLADEYIGQGFLNGFVWETEDDLTHGRVNYISQAEALQKNLTFVSDTKFVMAADSANVVPPDARGRDSIRIHSAKAYDEAVVVLDLQHMPEGCGTWPAFWTLSETGPWPNGGEIDIVEGVNLAKTNQAALHTMPNCTMENTLRLMTGNATAPNCDVNVNYNTGCTVAFRKPATYGPNFNAAGGGYYALARSKKEGVRIWFWGRDDCTVPEEVRAPKPGQEVHPTLWWGLPEAAFPLGENCDYESHFAPHQLTFDLTFCVRVPASLLPGVIAWLTVRCVPVGRLGRRRLPQLWLPWQVCGP